jgi:alcohol dehydrogenase (cytochrome c)/quinohemoprotein ethanol dehydrogenase
VPDPHWQRIAQGWITGMDFALAAMPADPAARQAAAAATHGQLIAWDPVSQSDRWRVEFKGPWNGGLLATAGGLVFQGNSASEFAAYDAGSGAKLWSSRVQTGIIAAPITYALDGEQYVAVLAGWGGSWALLPGVLSEVGGPVRNLSRLLVYKLDGSAELPPEQPIVRRALAPPPVSATPEQIALGARIYARSCGVCHGDAAYGSTLLPDLRRSAMLADPEGWAHIVLGGALQNAGMVSFARVLDAQQVDAVRQYVIKRANEDLALGDR